MRISELSQETGVSIPTIKYYLREDLLDPGAATAPNQAEYSSEHVRRLRLIRALTEVGGLSLRQVRAVLDAIDDDHRPLHELLGVAHHALGPPPPEDPPPPDLVQAWADVDRFLAGLGWRVSPEAPARMALAQALVALRRLGHDAEPEAFAHHARVAERLAAREVGTIDAGSRADAVEGAVLGTVVFEAALVALRRLAQEHHSAVRFSATGREEGRAAGAV